MHEDERSATKLNVDRIRAQLRPLLLAGLITTAITSGAMAVSMAADGITVMDLMSDPAELTGQPWYLGAVNSINLLIWAAGAALYMAVGIGLRPHHARLGDALAALGALTIVITLDDLLLLHEIFIPWVFGLPEILTFAIYAAVLLAILAYARSELKALPETPILVVAMLAFGGSVVLDTLGWDAVERRVAEEVLKLLGTTTWAAFPAALINSATLGYRAAAPSRHRGSATPRLSQVKPMVKPGGELVEHRHSGPADRGKRDG